jgi:hypothetical protein
MKRNAVVIGAVALAAVVAGMVRFKGDSTDQPAATTSSASNNDAGPAPAAGSGPPDASSPHDPASAAQRTNSTPLPADPRLAALQVSPDNGLIKFVIADNGKVIAEIDQDPASPGFGKPSREYIYMGDKVVALTAYRYMSDHVEITRTMVAYQPDGSVAEIKATTSYQNNAGQLR